MAFASIYVPDFLVQAVVRAEPALRGRAVALVDGTPPLWSVVAANEAALQAGIELGLAKAQAEQFRGVEIRPRSQGQEKIAHAALLDLGWSVSPRVEDTAPDSVALDLAGLNSLFGSEEEIARRLAQRASGFGLIAHVAVAANLEVAIHAARGFPGITLIPPGEESERLGSLPVGVLSPAAEVLETLERWGVRTCGALAALPALELSERLGQEGIRLHELARGARSRSLALAEADPIFEEEMALEYGVAELEPLAFLLGRLLDQLCARLAARSLAAIAVRSRFDLETRFPKKIRRGKKEPRGESASSVYEKVLALPVPMRNSKMLLQLLRLQLQASPPAAPILKIVLAAEPARPRTAQGGLFLPCSPDPEKLELTIARLANLVGDANIGSPELPDTHRPGEFRTSRFFPPRGTADRRKEEPAVANGELRVPPAGRQGNGFRIFRPTPPASVALHEGHPMRVSFCGLRGDVTAASGPWRTSGDWWREDAWQHDEWDLEIHFDSSSRRREKTLRSLLPREPQHGLYRFYYDSVAGKWFVRGAYD
jgi:protein ImuB